MYKKIEICNKSYNTGKIERKKEEIKRGNTEMRYKPTSAPKECQDMKKK
jgi:hypothetical protein